MTTYKWAAGFDEALEDLNEIDPQPTTPAGLQFARRQFAASGIVVDELPFVELVFDLPMTITQVQALYEEIGLDAANTAEVSVYVQDETFEWILRNGVAVRPLIGQDGRRRGPFVYGLTILVKNLRVQA